MPLPSRLLRRLPHIFVALLSVTALVLIALAHRNSPEQASHFLDKIMHSLHAPGFVGVTFFVFAVMRIYHRGNRNYRNTAIVTMGIAFLSEAAQIPGPRDAEVIDLVVDAIGITGALGLLALLDRDMRSRLRHRARVGLAVATLLALVYSFVPTAWWCYSWLMQQRAAPVLLSFEHLWERKLYNTFGRTEKEHVPAPDGWPLAGTVLRVTSSQRGGILEWRSYPDWSQHDYVTFLAATDDGNTYDVGLAIEDMRPDGEKERNLYRMTFEIGPGPQRIRIPLEPLRNITEPRPFELAHVNRTFMRMTERVPGVVIYFDDFRLE